MYVEIAIIVAVLAVVAYTIYVTRASRRKTTQKTRRKASKPRPPTPVQEPEEADPITPQDGEEDSDFLLRIMARTKPKPAAGRQFPNREDSRPEENQFGGMPSDHNGSH